MIYCSYVRIYHSSLLGGFQVFVATCKGHKCSAVEYKITDGLLSHRPALGGCGEPALYVDRRQPFAQSEHQQCRRRKHPPQNIFNQAVILLTNKFAIHYQAEDCSSWFKKSIICMQHLLGILRTYTFAFNVHPAFMTLKMPVNKAAASNNDPAKTCRLR